MTRPTMGFWVIGILLLLWNLMGDAAYLSQVTTDLDALARTDPATARAFAEMPKWVWGVYAVAVWSGTAAAIALLLRLKTLLNRILMAAGKGGEHQFARIRMARVDGQLVAIFDRLHNFINVTEIQFRINTLRV